MIELLCFELVIVDEMVNDPESLPISRSIPSQPSIPLKSTEVLPLGIATVKHPFFMAPAERAAARLSHQISESNALNRAIRINLISEDEDGNSGGGENVLEETSVSVSFFQKRTKLSNESESSNVKFKGVKLKRISSSDPPPFPLEFQIPKVSIQPFQLPNYFKSLSSTCNINLVEGGIKTRNRNHSCLSIPVPKLIKDAFSEMDSVMMKRELFNKKCSNKRCNEIFTEIVNEIEINSSSEQPFLWVLTGPSGVGKTKMIESIAERLNFRLITIDSSQIPRNWKTFETLQTAISHSTPKSFSQFFSNEKKKQRIAILFDEVEIAFESDRGYWTALTSFLHSPITKNVPIFITSNTDESFLESIIKFPDHVKFTEINGIDVRKLSINNDFINRLHRIDTSLEYEQLVMTTGYYYTEDANKTLYNAASDTGSDVLSVNLVREVLRWKELNIDNIMDNGDIMDNSEIMDIMDNGDTMYNGSIPDITNTTGISDITNTIDPFSYAEYASFSDLLISIKDNPVKMNLDYHDNTINCELFDFDNVFGGTEMTFTDNTLLYSIIPEICGNDHVPGLIEIVKECIGRTIKAFINEIQIDDRDIDRDISTYTDRDISTCTDTDPSHTINIKDHHYWKNLSKRLSRRFFDYTKSLQFHHNWSREITSHVIFLELNNFEASQSRRRKRAFYRYLGDELLNEILDIKSIEIV